MSHCPLKQAAFDSPNLLAIFSKDLPLNFVQLDQYVDSLKIDTECLIIKERSSIHLIALFFACWRQNKSIFPINPNLPSTVQLTETPQRSLLLFTSGSTATPKIAVLSFDNLIANASGAISALDLRPEDQWRLSLPLYHVGGIGILIRCILARATIALDDSPNITHLSYVPTQLYRSTPIYKKLRCLLLGGASTPSMTPKHLPIYTTYGLTEMGSMVTLNNQVLPQREVKLANDGEILVRGPCLFQGYLGQNNNDEWFHTNDLGKWDNGLIFCGRKDWMFISGGENIQPEEIEQELLTLPEIIEAVVVPKNDPEFGSRPVAIVRNIDFFDLKKMQSALSKKLPKFKIPIELHLLDEIPKNSNFKINRFILMQTINNK